MPGQIDSLVERLPKTHVLYRYHCRYVHYWIFQENNGFIKLLERVGCDLNNTIIIDRS